MSQRFAARNGDDAGAEAGEMVDAAEHLVDRDGFGDLVVLVAIGTGEVAEAHRDDLRHDDVMGRGQRMPNDAQLPQFAGDGFDPARGGGFWNRGGGGAGGKLGF